MAMKWGSCCTLFCVSLLCIVMVAALYLIVLIQQPKCELTKEEPRYDLEHLKASLSSDSKTMVKFAGYLQYMQAVDVSRLNELDEIKPPPVEVEPQFMALEFDSVSYAVSNKEKGTSFLVMETNCSSIKVTLVDKISIQAASLITLTLDVPNMNEAECEAVPGDINAKTGEHYLCKKKKTYDCYSLDPKTKSKLLVKLIITEFEFEVSGNAFVHKKGNFSTNATLCA